MVLMTAAMLMTSVQVQALLLRRYHHVSPVIWTSSRSQQRRIVPLMASPTSSIAREDDHSSSNSKIDYQWTKQTRNIAIPALIGMLADPLLSLMDTAYVGRLGATELAALGACTSIFHLAFNAFRATTTATTSLVATQVGQSPERARQVTLMSLQLGWTIGLLVFVGLYFGAPWCLQTMGVARAGVLFPPAFQYLTTRCWAAPAVLSIVVAEGAFRGYSDAKIPLLASVVASCINLVLDPILMFPPIALRVAGAAAATAASQLGGAIVYAYFLLKRKMLPQPQDHKDGVSRVSVFKTILGANAAMMTKQGSLLFGWAYATSRATRMGPAHVAAHQVALSIWLVFALCLDGAAVSAQVLMSRAYAEYKDEKSRRQVTSLLKYKVAFAMWQGLASMLILTCAAPVLPQLFTSDAAIQGHLRLLMPQLIGQQVLVSLTLVIESLAIGGQQFSLLALGTALTTLVAMDQMSRASHVVALWSRGIVCLFTGRLLTSLVGVWRMMRMKKHQIQET